MARPFVRSMGLSVLTGAALGGLYGSFEYVTLLIQDSVVFAGRSLPRIWFDNVFFYTLVFAAVFLLFGVLLSVLFGLFARFFPKRDPRPLLPLHLVSAGLAGLMYLHFIAVINKKWLPGTFDTFNIVANILLLAAVLLLYAILFFACYLLYRKWNPFLALVSKLSVALGLVFVLNVIVGALILVAGPVSNKLASSQPAGKPEDKPNVVLLTIDTMRFDYLGCYGSSLGLTPNLDRLSREGTLFENAYSVCPWTLPSLVTMLTGLYPEVHQACESKALASERVTVPEIVRQHGYATASVLSNHWLKTKWNSVQGFDYVYHADEPWFLKSVPGTRIYEFLGYFFGKVFMKEGADNITDKALHWLRIRPGRPFFLWIHYIDPHIPYGGSHMKMRPPHEGYEGPIGSYWGDYNGVVSGKVVLSAADKTHLEYLYSGDVFFVDHHVGRIWDYLESEGLWDRTAIVFTADHGEEFWEHGEMHHGRHPHREVTQVPLIIKPPGGARTPRVGELTSIIDTAPTLLELAGVEPAAEMQGRSLVPTVRGEGGTGTPIAFSSYVFDRFKESEQKVVRRGGYSLFYFTADHHFELFNLAEDPWEQTDVFEKEGEVSGQLTELLHAYLDDMKLAYEQLTAGETESNIKLDAQEEKRLRSLGYID